MPIVRPAEMSDAETIVRFNEAMAAETEDKSLDLETLRAGVRSMLVSPKRGFYLIAEQEAHPAGPENRASEREEAIVGSLMITTEWSDWRNGMFWWVQSVYVRPKARRQGVYTALYAEVKRRARAAADVCGLRLYVEESNAVAREVYVSLGMVPTSYRMYEETL